MAEAEEEETRLTTTEEEGNKEEGEGIWGTWEELLLVSAVNRHGTKNWESVAMEIQNRITSSSSSLQLKVKRLKEEREHSSKDSGEVKPDLETKSQNLVAEKPIPGEDSDRENQSFNESNSSDPKRPISLDTKPETVEPVGNVSKPAGEDSCNGSSETIGKNTNSAVSQALKLEPIQKRETRESTELWESFAESKEVVMKENSDVQSSASLSHRRKKDVSVSSSGGEEISPAMKRLSVKSQPLVKIFEIIKGHKYGSVFERRLESQETPKYKNLIRQHLDLETVSKRLNEGKYSGSSRKFFRDLLLLINNAIVFFSPNSVEFTAAIELRQIVSKEMGTRIRKSSQSPEAQQPPEPTITPPALPKPDPEPLESLLVKPKITIPMIACRKRTPVSTKASIVVSERKKEAVVVDEKKPVFAHPVEEQIVINKGKRERPASGTRSSRTAGKNQNNTNSNKNSNVNSNRNASPSSNPSSSGKGLAVDDNSETKTDKEKKNGVTSVAKKRSVANFLNRMKRNTSSNGALLESLKNSGNNSSNGKGSNAEPKRGSGGRGDARKEQPTRQSSSRKQAREQSSPAKRGVGRPPKRHASSPITPPSTSKRARESTEKEVAASRQPRKRSRR
ncbi:hypothetical protein IFM89_019301 [Coptis chinensis]|uniref:Bromo domain-containing protein n=1 Tax=Coptis chinensis TaxID=261450 RepID=A0A835ICW2_9MAGN|nr:hypothetical protein IFM89_019301 [Coptis chinensis]